MLKWDTSEQVTAATIHQDPYLRSTFPLGNRLRRAAWGVIWLLLFRPSLRPMFGWRRFLLRVFGARVGSDSNVYPSARIWAPWLLELGNASCLADDVEVYNPAGVMLGHHAIVSQGAYLCGATHDVHHPAFPYISKRIELGSYVWVAARAIVLPGVTISEGAVLAAGAVAPKNLEPWTIYAGNPARKIGLRNREHT